MHPHCRGIEIARFLPSFPPALPYHTRWPLPLACLQGNMEVSEIVEVAAPGKVLICGGYVVLRGGHSLVLSTSSRFHSTLVAQTSAAKGDACSIDITVRSPQFGKFWRYACSWVPGANIDACNFSFSDTSPAESGSNIYVESSLLYALATAAALRHGHRLSKAHYTLELTIQADNDFYSHSKAVRLHIHPSNSAFCSAGRPVR